MLISRLAIKRIENFPDRPTIVFLHDALGCIELWRDFPEKLGELTKCNVLVYDRQGHGNSCDLSYTYRENSYLEEEAEILIDLLNCLDIKNTILFGHSDGGSIALIAAAKYPDHIDGIVAEAAHVFVEEVTIQGVRDSCERYLTTDLKSRLSRYHGLKTERLFWAWADTWNSSDYRDWSIENLLGNIKCKTLIIQGEEDEFGTLKQVDCILNRIGEKAKKMVLEDVGHNPHKEKPQYILNETARFISTILTR
ncbi:alpha/beta fold hydrolase [Jiulongibacter sediminis]|uniref:alpha/beta fold hydrolase n=1 Tax=Jiulongibacter sediminis TaxID=1605367 RepID=UPI0026EF42E4|nr:alpha/beta hydrolase [Jiulongibacter sediminis]